jgi:hypothetical protein
LAQALFSRFISADSFPTVMDRLIGMVLPHARDKPC